MGKRFETLNGVYSDMIKDCKTNKIYTRYSVDGLTDLLNEQDEKIRKIDQIKELQQENKQLRQFQNSKAIEVLEKLKNDFFDYAVTINIMEHRAVRLCNIRKVIDNQIAELRGGK